jgi:hypothetical protein
VADFQNDLCCFFTNIFVRITTHTQEEVFHVQPIQATFKEGQNHILFFLGQSHVQAHGLGENAWHIQAVGAALEKNSKEAIDQDDESNDHEQIL